MITGTTRHDELIDFGRWSYPVDCRNGRLRSLYLVRCSKNLAVDVLETRLIDRCSRGILLFTGKLRLFSGGQSLHYCVKPVEKEWKIYCWNYCQRYGRRKCRYRAGHGNERTALDGNIRDCENNSKLSNHNRNAYRSQGDQLFVSSSERGLKMAKSNFDSRHELFKEARPTPEAYLNCSQMGVSKYCCDTA